MAWAKKVTLGYEISSVFRSPCHWLPALKPTKVTLFTIILYNSENDIRDVRPFLLSIAL